VQDFPNNFPSGRPASAREKINGVTRNVGTFMPDAFPLAGQEQLYAKPPHAPVSAPLKLVQQLFPPFLGRLHPSQHVLFQNHFIGRCHIHRSCYATTLMTSLNRGAPRDAYFSAVIPNASTPGPPTSSAVLVNLGLPLLVTNGVLLTKLEVRLYPVM
jgi:hypothetical protein